MISLKNELPVAVHLASGGEARLRTGGQAISLNGISSGSFQVMSGTRFRAKFGMRSVTGLSLLIGYSSPLTLANASTVASDTDDIYDDVPEGTTVYFSIIGPADDTPVLGGEHDYLYVSFYD